MAISRGNFLALELWGRIAEEEVNCVQIAEEETKGERDFHHEKSTRVLFTVTVQNKN